MALLNAETKLSEVILNEPTLIPVINRFGITLGLGDKTIRAVCEERKLDTDFFLTILNTFVNEAYFPEKPTPLPAADVPPPSEYPTESP